MRLRWILVILVGLALMAVVLVTRGAGLSARRSAWPGEARTAQLVRAWTLPGAYRALRNPVPASSDAVRAGMEHWADHCASCHGNDGRGQTALGRSLFPPAPDMTDARTQRQTDGALFYAIEHGVPFTGMPAWSTGMEEGERSSWELVLFIRRLPALTQDEIALMETLNPKSAAQIEQEHQMEQFLNGGK